MAAMSAVGRACTIVSAQVGPDFKVKVEDRSHPVEGLRIEIKGFQAVTDARGIAAFAGVPPGDYTVTTGAGREADAVYVTVRAAGSPNITVPMRWPAWKLVAVRSLRGSLHLPDGPTPLDLLDARSGRKLKSTQMNERGEFDFGITTPGMYLIEVDATRSTGEIAVSVEPDARASQLDLDLGWTSCGMLYSDRSDCQRGDVSLDRFAGIVTDVTGANIPNAKIVLRDESAAIVEVLNSTNDGKFTSASSLAGAYTLEASFAGFRPYHGRVHIDPKLEANPQRGINIRLDLFGSCTTDDPR
jgi:hypothetical protein